MSLIYLISSLAIIILFTIAKKTNNKLNIIKTICINIVLFWCYNVVICYINHWINIKSNLETLSIENMIFIIPIVTYILKTKKVQKYEIYMRDIIFLITLVIVVIVITYLYYGIPIKIKYFMTDAANHYSYAKFFYQNSTLMVNGIRPAGYINGGILLKIFEPVVGIESLYKIFILFDVFIFMVQILLVYFAITAKIKNKLEYIIAVIISMICLCGYPLNNLLGGSTYLEISITFVLARNSNVTRY